jgi:Arc/MetJ-type ribon-helix-helix transcriptional regulator
MASKSKRGRSGGTDNISARLPETDVRDLETLAYENSSPHTDVTRADVVRAAVRDYIKKHEANLEECDPWERGGLQDGPTKQVTTKVQEQEIKEIERIVYELSEPRQKISKSDVIRAAVRDYIDKHENGVRECKPAENGKFDFPFKKLVE